MSGHPDAGRPGGIDDGAAGPQPERRRGVRLGIDVGQARVGVARSDPDGRIAFAEATLRRDLKNGTDLDAVLDLVREHDAVEVVVGLPRLLSGQEGTSAGIAREYALAIAARVDPTTRVALVDERLTTVDAAKRLRESGVPGRGQRAVVDQAAAVLILQSALDTETTSGRPPGLDATRARKPRTKERRR